MNRIRVLVVSDSRLLREGIQVLLSPCPNVEIVGAVQAGDEAVREAGRLKPHIVLLDLPKLETTQLELVGRLQAELPGIRVIALSYGMDEASVLQVLDMGIQGYLCGREGPADLRAAVQAVAEGDSFLCPGASGILVRRYRGKRSKRRVEVGKHDS